MYLFFLLFCIGYMILYPGIAGGCLTASLFGVLIYALIKNNKDIKTMNLSVEIPRDTVVQNRNFSADIVISGCHWREARELTVTYVLISSLYKNQKKKKIKMICEPGRNSWKTKISIPTENSDSIFVNITEIALRDLTGLTARRIKIWEQKEILVLPLYRELHSMDEFFFSGAGGDDYEYEGIREMVSGDSPSQIHWKLLAAKGDWFVKDRKEDDDEMLGVALEYTEFETKGMNDYLSFVYSVGASLLEDGLWIRFYCQKAVFDVELYSQLSDVIRFVCRNPVQKEVAETENKDGMSLVFHMEDEASDHYVFYHGRRLDLDWRSYESITKN